MKKERFAVQVESKRHEDDHGVLYPYVTSVNPPCQRNDELLFESESKERTSLVFRRILRIQVEAEKRINQVLRQSQAREERLHRTKWRKENALKNKAS